MGKKGVFVSVSVVVALAGLIVFLAGPIPQESPQTYSLPEPPIQQQPAPGNIPPEAPSGEEFYASQQAEGFTVSQNELLFTGGYADPSVIEFGGRYLMYLNTFGGTQTGVYILESSDGVTWSELTEVIFPGIATARAFEFERGIRLYYPNNGELHSTISVDGVTNWVEDGVLLSPKTGYKLEGPTVIQTASGYRMFFDEFDAASQGDGNILTGEIYGASSPDGVAWTRDAQPTIVFEDAVEGFGRAGSPKQVLHPFIIEVAGRGYYMFYNAHSEVFVAHSDDAVTWEKLGYVGLHGADVDIIPLDDGTFRMYYGDFSPETLGVVYTTILRLE